MLQLLCHVAMEPPVDFTADEVRDEKVKVLHAITPPRDDVARCRPRAVHGRTVGRRGRVGYTDEEGVPPTRTPRPTPRSGLEVDNWRWAGVPFYLRTGKRLARKVTEIAITSSRSRTSASRRTARSACSPTSSSSPCSRTRASRCSSPGQDPRHAHADPPVNMEFLYGTSFLSQSPEAYER
jgi:glucose-6-phosphate 1-dehydrogenase